MEDAAARRLLVPAIPVVGFDVINRHMPASHGALVLAMVNPSLPVTNNHGEWRDGLKGRHPERFEHDRGGVPQGSISDD